MGVYTLFGYGFATGGPLFVWGLPIVVLGQLLVVLVFAELAVEYPLAGALYQWGKRLVGPRYGWFIGWIYGWALVITIAAVDLGAAPYLADLLQVQPSRGTLALLASALLLAHTAMNLVGVRATALVTKVGLGTEVVATLVIAGALLLGPGAGGHLRPLSALFSLDAAAGGLGGSGFLASLLAMAWIFYGFESAADVAEEVIDPERQVPRAMILSLLGAAFVTLALTVALVLSSEGLGDAGHDPNRVMGAILGRHLGPGLLKGLLVLLMSAYLSCAGAAQAAAARLLYSYARDGMVPFSPWLRQVSPAHRAPRNAILLSSVLALGVVGTSFVDVGAVNVNALVVSYAVVGIYLSFQSVVLGRLVAAFKGHHPRPVKGRFSLGRWGVPVSVLALVYGVSMIGDLCWPRPKDQLSSWLPLIAAITIALPGILLAAAGLGQGQGRDGPPSEA